MSHETEIINKALNKFQLSSVTLDSLKRLLLEVVGIFDAQGKGALNVSKNMVIVLHKVLVTNEPSFLSWIGEFADENFSLHIAGLRSLKNSNEVCYNALVETHTVFGTVYSTDRL